MQLQPGTYYVGVSASGNDQYDPSLPDSGMGGTTEGPYELRLNFTPLTTGPATAVANGDIVLSGSNIVLKTGTTPFVQGQVLGQVAITGIDATHVPNVAALDGETFKISNGASQPFTFEFVDTSVRQAPSKATWRSTSIRRPTTSTRSAPTWSPPSTAWSRTWSVPRARSSTAMPTVRRAAPTTIGSTSPGRETTPCLSTSPAPSTVQNGSLANPYQTVSAALAAAAVDSQAGHHDIVRIEGNAGGIALIDANGNDITGKNLADKETFSVSDGTIGCHLRVYQFDAFPADGGDARRRGRGVYARRQRHCAGGFDCRGHQQSCLP